MRNIDTFYFCDEPHETDTHMARGDGADARGAVAHGAVQADTIVSERR